VKLLVFSDIHGDIARLERLMATEADYYFAAGDLTSWGRGLDRCGPVLARRAERVYVLPGNHESARDIADFAQRFALHDFHGRSFEADGFHVAGLGYSTPTPFNTPGEWSEQDMGRALEPFAALKPLALVCHCPPLDTQLDRIRKGAHAGSRAVREFIERHEPEYFFCGHIHEAEGIEITLGKTRCWNVGPAGHLLEL
jgi:Icc-related predicted phosphoesterase